MALPRWAPAEPEAQRVLHIQAGPFAQRHDQRGGQWARSPRSSGPGFGAAGRAAPVVCSVSLGRQVCAGEETLGLCVPPRAAPRRAAQPSPSDHACITSSLAPFPKLSHSLIVLFESSASCSPRARSASSFCCPHSVPLHPLSVLCSPCCPVTSPSRPPLPTSWYYDQVPCRH